MWSIELLHWSFNSTNYKEFSLCWDHKSRAKSGKWYASPPPCDNTLKNYYLAISTKLAWFSFSIYSFATRQIILGLCKNLTVTSGQLVYSATWIHVQSKTTLRWTECQWPLQYTRTEFGSLTFPKSYAIFVCLFLLLSSSILNIHFKIKHNNILKNIIEIHLYIKN